METPTTRAEIIMLKYIKQKKLRKRCNKMRNAAFNKQLQTHARERQVWCDINKRSYADTLNKLNRLDVIAKHWAKRHLFITALEDDILKTI